MCIPDGPPSIITQYEVPAMIIGPTCVFKRQTYLKAIIQKIIAWDKALHALITALRKKNTEPKLYFFK